MYILHTVLYTFPLAYKENLPNNQELIVCAMISLILITLLFGSGVIM